MSQWRQQWAMLQQALNARGATGRWAAGADKPPTFELDPPANEDEIRGIEVELGQAIPESMRHVLEQFASRVRIEWALPDEIRPPEVFREVWSGECRWDLRSLPALQATHREWIRTCFTGKQPPDWEKPPHLIEYDLVWHRKFVFLEVGNGDMVGIDIARTDDQPVVYLSHEDGPCHGYRLGNDFEDYVDRLTALAFVGAEDWQLAPFVLGAAQGLQTASENALEWRRWLGISGGDV